MKLSKEQKEKMIGEKVIVDRILVKENEWPVDNLNYLTKSLRKIKTEKLKEPVKAVIVGFTTMCDGKFDYDNDGMSFTCTKRIPCTKIATGIVGKIQYAPMSIIEQKEKIEVLDLAKTLINLLNKYCPHGYTNFNNIEDV